MDDGVWEFWLLHLVKLPWYRRTTPRVLIRAKDSSVPSLALRGAPR